MDILQQVAKLVQDMEKAEKRKQTEQEINMGVLLQEATRQYVECVKARKWKRAHDQLVDICRLVSTMIAKLPAE